jgi:predicted amidohydrolase YtcJ
MTMKVARLAFLAVLAIAAPAAGRPAAAQPADTVLVNGRIVTLDGTIGIREAIAVRDGRIAAVGRSADIRKLAGGKTLVVDLGGRTVIPGLIDSHIHAIRAALFYATEVNWIGTHSIAEAMARLTAAAKAKPGGWLIVAGGWTEAQFYEKRRPTQAELVAAAPDSPVYIQHFYDAALLSPAGMKALGINGDADVPPKGRLILDAEGKPTGWIEGDNPTITSLFGKLPTPSFEQSVDGTRQFFRELNRLALTGVIDPGGFNMAPKDYQPLLRVWQDRQLTLRVAYNIFAQRAGKELEDFQDLTQLMPMGFGDDLLRFNGIGESITWGMYNNDSPTDAQKEQFYQTAKWAAERRMGLTIHWPNDKSAGQLLDIFERVNRTAPIGDLRWSIAHLNDASKTNLRRMLALGIGWTMQDAMYFDGERFIAERGAEAAERTPPIKTALNMGLHVGAGTDAHRVMSYSPFVALQWMLDGKTVGGTPTRDKPEVPTREEALRLYTLGSAWFARDEEKRGSVAVGKLADLAVLTEDYMTVPVARIRRIESVLTMVGGKIVYAAAPFAKLAAQPGL